MQNIKDKLQCKNKSQLIEFAISNNILYKVPKELLVGFLCGVIPQSILLYFWL